MEKLLLTPEEAAAALGICRSKLYELLRAGVIESVHIGASRRIPLTSSPPWKGRDSSHPTGVLSVRGSRPGLGAPKAPRAATRCPRAVAADSAVPGLVIAQHHNAITRPRQARSAFLPGANAGASCGGVS